MKRALVLVLLVVTASCSAGSPSPATEQITSPTVTLPPENPGPGDQWAAIVDGDGVVRHYLVHAPNSYSPDSKYPLVVMFHGSSGTPEDMADRTKMNDVADANGFLVVYPQSMFDTAGAAALLDHLGQTWNVDPKQIHVAGFSRGGTLVYQLAEAMAERFGSVAPVSASRNATISLSHPVSLITFQGGRDRLHLAWKNLNAAWDAAAGCSDESVTTTTTTVQDSPTDVSSKTCTDGTEHVVYSVEDMTHVWPAGASELIWEFFAAHPLA